jgi:hypothetical protein
MLDKSPDAAGAELVPNKGDISAHLYAMFPPAFVQAYPDAWIEIAYGRAATGNKVNQANIFSVFDLKEAAEFAAAKNKLGFNLYAGVALRQGAHPDSGRANDDSVVTAGYGSAEFDTLATPSVSTPFSKNSNSRRGSSPRPGPCLTFVPTCISPSRASRIPPILQQSTRH